MNALKAYREKNELSQQQLAERLGRKYQSDVYYMEKRLEAGRGLRPEVALDISTKTGIPKNELLYPSEARQAAA